MAPELKTSATLGSVFEAIDPDNPDYLYLQRIVSKLVPFGTHAGIEITEISPRRATVEIPDEPYILNHLRTVHAGAQFLAADIAGACAFVGALATRLSAIETLVLRDARLSFRKPALGRIRAIGVIDPSDVATVLAAKAGQRVDVDARALMYDAAGVLVGKVALDYVCTLAAEA
ncbi:YiiD C-terminal domain-containing protein [Nocardia sp. NPDC048505]|uniref:YiiD C-terminal domain-containing protein n=1 Tax=Nocardia sp. NPDC048505 TaxID=3155756 RepID=UPI0033EE8312